MGTRIVDDRDPSIVYTSGWGTAGGPNEQNFTTSWTTSQGPSATLHFTGSGVAVYGTITNEGLGNAPISAYSIDGGAQTVYTGIQTSSIQYKVRFFQSATLSSGDHTLVVTCATGDAFLYLDYFEVTLPSIISSSSRSTSSATPTSSRSSTTSLSLSSSSSSTSSSTSSSSTSSKVSSISSTTSTSDTPQSHVTEIISSTVTVTSDGSKASDVNLFSSSSKSVAIGPIVGGVVGGVLVLALLIFLFLFCRRRRRRYTSPITLPNSPSTTRLTTQLVTPFPVATPSTPYSPTYPEATGSSSQSLETHQQILTGTMHHSTHASGLLSQAYSAESVPMTQSTLSLLPNRRDDGSAAKTYVHEYPPSVNASPSSNIIAAGSYETAAQVHPTSAIVLEKKGLTGQSYISSSPATQSAIGHINTRQRSSGFTYDPPPSYNDIR
ncbi:hypothetical protein CVT25_002404 [Psilocybe cyanescens]|uniref:Uncharacterized protein n=1 Tax=Psilocybe cyanescens TaxID=93625 RepID=A0A409WKC0_PSICY|nr:hypothetical protein CVT25_002404 [Psilocybe cyanescens]